jgi:TRAP-type C4-dicarboxylate transport system permease small subunit
MSSPTPKPLQMVMKLFDVLVVVGMAVMSVMVFLNVVLRYGFNSGIPISVELSRIIFVWIIMLGSIAALAQGAHLAVDSFGLVAALFMAVCLLFNLYRFLRGELPATWAGTAETATTQPLATPLEERL